MQVYCLLSFIRDKINLLLMTMLPLVVRVFECIVLGFKFSITIYYCCGNNDLEFSLFYYKLCVMYFMLYNNFTIQYIRVNHMSCLFLLQNSS